MPLRIPATVTGLEASIEAAAKKAGKNLKINLGSGAKSIEGLSQPLGRITGKADQFTKSMEAANARVLAFGASVGVLSAVSRGFKELITTTIQVEKQLVSINSILKGTTSQLESFKKVIFDVARNTEQSFETVATAALELSRQGLKAEVVIKRLNDSLILSRLSGLGASEAVAGLTAAVNSFRKEGVSSAEVLNKLSAASIKAAVSERDLIEGIKRSGSVATQAGVSLNELIGVISAVQEKTARGGAVIGNSFKTIFTRIQSLDKLKTMQNLGIQVTDASGEVLSATRLIQNLGKTLQNLPEAKQLQIAEGLVGKFQIAPFLAILDDYNSKTSVAINITEVAANATNEAYTRNVVLNKTLSAAINEATVNLKELASILGEIGVTDSLQNILSFFNTLVTNIKGLLEGEGLGSDFAKGIIKGIGGVLSGPGLAIFGAIIAKLTIDLVRFGTGSLKTFFGLNRAAKAQATLQGQIASTLLGNKGIQQQILTIENSTLTVAQKRAAQTKFFTTALNEQLRVMSQMQSIASRIAPGVGRGTRGGRGRAAGGYIPNFDAVSGYGSEQQDIARGVGGAPRSARPVNIPNFNFGGGQRGSITANSSEFIVPNFAGKSGSAIFNRDMAASIGLPSGARKIGAAAGYIPNFAQPIPKNNKQEIILLVGARKGDSPATEMDSYTDYSKKKNGEQKFVQKGKIPLDVLDNVDQETYRFKLPSYSIAPNETGRPPFDTEAISDRVSKDAGLRNVQFFKKLPGSEKLLKGRRKYLSKVIVPGDVSGVSGLMFESMAKSFLSDPNFEKVKAYQKNTILDSHVDENVRGLFGIGNKNAGSKGAEMKVHDGDTHIASFARKVFDVLVGKKAAFGGPKKALDRKAATKNVRDRLSSEERERLFTKTGRIRSGSGLTDVTREANDLINTEMNLASGYIPNFAGALEDSIARESSAGVPINQIRVNQSGSLRNAGNPMGLAVTNTRDEPTGAIPNFVTLESAGISKSSKAVARSLDSLNQRIDSLNKEVQEGTMSFDQANKEVAEFAKGIKTSKGNREKLVKASTSEIEEKKKGTRAQRDLLGPIFAFQAGLSFLSGMTADAGGALAKFTNIVSTGLSGVSSAAFAGVALSDFGNQIAESGGAFKGALGKAVSKLGLYGAAIGAGISIFKTGVEIYNEASGVNKRATEALAQLADVTDKLRFRFDQLSKLRQSVAETGGAEAVAKKFAQTRTVRKTQVIGGEVIEVGKARSVDASVNREFTGGFGKTADDVEAGFVGIASQMVGMGLSVKEVDARLQRFGEVLNLKDLRDFMKQLEELDKIYFKSRTQFKEALRLEYKGPEGLKRLEEAIKDFKSGNTGKALGEVRKRAGFEDAGKEVPGTEKLVEYELFRLELLKRNESASKKVNTLNLEYAKLILKQALERKKIELGVNQVISKRVSTAEILGNLTKDQMRSLKALQFEEGITNKLVTSRFDVFTKLLGTMDGIVAVEGEVKDARKEILSLTRGELADDGRIEEVMVKILTITQKLPEAQKELIRNILKGNNATEIGIKLTGDHGREMNRVKDAAEGIKEALELASKVRLSNIAGEAFKGTFDVAGQISAKEAEKARISNELGKAAVPSITRGLKSRLDTLENELAILRTQQAKIETTAILRKIALPPVEIGREWWNSGLSGVVKDDEEAREKLAKGDPTQAREILQQMLIAYEEFGSADQVQDLKDAIRLAEEEIAKKKEAARIGVENARIQGEAAKALEVALSNIDLRIDQAGRVGLVSSVRADKRRKEAVRLTGVEGSEFHDLTEANAILLSDMQRSAVQRVLEAPEFDPITNADALNEKLKDAALNFKNTMSDAMIDAIIKGESLGDVLRSAATDFFTTLSKAYMNNAVNSIVGNSLGGSGGGGGGGGGGFNPLSFIGNILGMGKNSGGLITGGSGSRDDIPTLLTGGEFVMRREAVQQYGARFLESLNAGGVGQMQRGGLYTPGTYGQGAIKGKEDLLNFTTQGFTTGQHDITRGGRGFAEVGLEPHSGALTRYGIANSPSARQETQSQLAAFGLFTDQVKLEEKLKEEEKARKKALMSSLMAAVGAAAFSTLVGGMKKQQKMNNTELLSTAQLDQGGNAINFGRKTGAGKAGGGGGNWFTNLFSGIGDKGGGGLNSLLSGGTSVGQAFQRQEGARDFADAIYNLGGNLRNAGDAWARLPEEAQAQYVSDWRAGAVGVSPRDFARNQGYAHGGAVPHAAGIDTVPTMLSGGEFVMNAAATQNIGRGNLATMNAGGGGGDNGSGEIVGRLDELIDVSERGRGETVINITVNSEGTTTQDGDGTEAQQSIATRIRDVVRQVISDEQRLGGALRTP